MTDTIHTIGTLSGAIEVARVTQRAYLRGPALLNHSQDPRGLGFSGATGMLKALRRQLLEGLAHPDRGQAAQSIRRARAFAREFCRNMGIA